MTIISEEEYHDIKANFDKPLSSGKGRGNGTYARTVASILLSR